MKIKRYLATAVLCFALLIGCKKDDQVPEKSGNASEAPIRPITSASKEYVSELIEYLPAPGQFINQFPGDLASAQSIIGKKGLVTLGAWGGNIILGFDHTVLNSEGTDDFIVWGNPSASIAEPAVVWVMQDQNGNGKADDIWFEIAGSEFGKVGYVRNYEITYTKPDPVTADISWRDNKGNSGLVKTNSFHKQAYYPLWLSGNEYTIKGTLLPMSNFDMSNPTFVTNKPFDWGYADNTVGGDKFDIANAIDEKGERVSLAGIDFIKIQTGIQANMGWLGELSTEITGVADLSMVEE